MSSTANMVRTGARTYGRSRRADGASSASVRSGTANSSQLRVPPARASARPTMSQSRVAKVIER